MANVQFLDMYPAQQVFLYNLVNRRAKDASFDSFVHLDENETTQLTSIKTHNNHIALVEGYALSPQLYRQARSYYDMNMPVRDLGITLILANFASYMSYNQYFLLVHDFNCVEELDLFEQVLLGCSDNYVKLPFDLAIDRKYGLRAVSSRMGDRFYTYDKFVSFVRFLSNKDITVESFINAYVDHHHPRIVESLYAITSFKRSNSTIYDCRRLNANLFKYSMDPVMVVDEKDYSYNGIYWFHVSRAHRVTWFATTCGKVWYKGYMSRHNERKLIDTFATCSQYIIVGLFINESGIYPVRVDGIDYAGDWQKTRTLFREHGFNDIFQTGMCPSFAKSYFVVNSNPNIFKFK